MKKILIIALITFPSIILAQGGKYIIQGQVGSLNDPAKVYLSYKEDGINILKTAPVKNGKFRIKGKVNDYLIATVILDHNGKGLPPNGRYSDALNVYLEKGKIIISGKDSIKTAIISGSVVNQENKTYTSFITPVNSILANIVNEYRSASPEQQKDSVFINASRSKYDEALKTKRELQEKFISDNPASYISLLTVKELISNSTDIEKEESYFNKLSPYLRNSIVGKEVVSIMNTVRATALGAQALDFTQNDVNDIPVKLSDFKGKYVLLDFWAAWCGPCRKENPNLVKAYNQYKDKNFTILGVSLDQPDKKEAWLAAIKKDGLLWTNVSDLKFWANDVAVMYGVKSIPQNYLIDPNGKIIARNLRGEELNKKLDEIFN